MIRAIGHQASTAKNALRVMKRHGKTPNAIADLKFSAAIFGTLGTIKVPDLMTLKYGEMFSLFNAFNSAFVYEDRLCTISVLGVPTIKDLAFLRFGISALCLLCDTYEADWQVLLEQAWAFLLDNSLLSTLVLVTSESQLSSLLAASRPLREMQENGIKLFVISELSEIFINDFFYEIIQLKLNPKMHKPAKLQPDQADKSSLKTDRRCRLM
jgi:hypothetical protein